MTVEEFNKRFKTPIDKKKKDAIVKLIKKTRLPLEKIAEESEVSTSTVKRIAKKALSEEEYDERFQTVTSKEKIDAIIKLIKTTELSLREIASTLKEQGIEVSVGTVQKFAKETLSKEEYDERFQTPLSEKKKDDIMRLIKTTQFTLQRIAEETGVSIRSVERVAQGRMTKQQYDKRFPKDDRRFLGTLFHKSATKQFSDWGKSRGIKVLSEHNIVKEIPRFSEIKRRPDDLIKVDKSFSSIYNIPPYIKYIVLDYTTDTSQSNLDYKAEKGYQSEDTLFIHIPFALDEKSRSRKEYQIPTYVPFSHNIWVLPEDDFFTFFKFSREEKKEFMDKIWDIYRKSKSQKSLLEDYD